MQPGNVISFDPAKPSDHDQSELEANIWISFYNEVTSASLACGKDPDLASYT